MTGGKYLAQYTLGLLIQWCFLVVLNHYGFDFDYRSLVEACNEGDISKVRKLLDEGRVSVHDTTEEGESLLSLACSAGYFELAQVNALSLRHGLLVKLLFPVTIKINYAIHVFF